MTPRRLRALRRRRTAPEPDLAPVPHPDRYYVAEGRLVAGTYAWLAARGYTIEPGSACACGDFRIRRGDDTLDVRLGDTLDWDGTHVTPLARP